MGEGGEFARGAHELRHSTFANSLPNSPAELGRCRELAIRTNSGRPEFVSRRPLPNSGLDATRASRWVSVVGVGVGGGVGGGEKGTR